MLPPLFAASDWSHSVKYLIQSNCGFASPDHGWPPVRHIKKGQIQQHRQPATKDQNEIFVTRRPGNSGAETILQCELQEW